MENKYSRTKTIAIVMFATLVLAMIVALIMSGNGDYVDKFGAYVISIIPLTVGVLYMGKQNDSIKDDVSQIRTNVNGKLDVKLNEITAKLDTHAVAIDNLDKRITELHS